MKGKLFCAVAWLFLAAPAAGQERILDDQLHHLRVGGPREWAEFPEWAEASRLVIRFGAEPNSSVQTLRLRQQDVKHSWRIVLNGRELGRLHQDENDMSVYWPIPAGVLKEGENILAIEQEDTTPDDIRVGAVVLDARPPAVVLSEAGVEVVIIDAGSGAPIPGRITIISRDGALQTVAASSNDSLAVRPGVVYTGTGRAAFGLPPGAYTIYAGRGFEYSVDSAQVTVRANDHLPVSLAIRRDVPTDGYVSTDTHVHTLAHSGHGDATVRERVLTLAGEGVELAIVTEHNLHADYDSMARAAGVRAYVTPVVGNEVTSGVGHFNIFPVTPGAPAPDHRLMDWDSLFTGIYRTPGVRAVILNHPRDVHRTYRPFDPLHHLAVVGERADGWALRANAMEIVNSGAQQSDGMRLVHDWFGMLNGGYALTPVGGSDAHDVSRYIVGQARTYIRAQDDEPGRIDVNEAVENFLQGRVAVSLGLLAEVTVDGRYGPGQLAPAADTVTVAVRVLGPGWTTAERVELYANGHKVREAAITEGTRPGVKWDGTWRLPRPAHDVFLSAVAHGPGVTALFWPIAKPYQPTSPVWERYVLGVSGAVWIDGDGDGRRSSAFDLANALVTAADGDVPGLIQDLATYDEAVAAQAASALAARGMLPGDARLDAAMNHAAPATRRGFKAFHEAWSRSASGNGLDGTTNGR